MVRIGIIVWVVNYYCELWALYVVLIILGIRLYKFFLLKQNNNNTPIILLKFNFYWACAQIEIDIIKLIRGYFSLNKFTCSMSQIQFLN